MGDITKNICPCGISLDAWMFCSANTCDVCINSKKFIDTLMNITHTDRSVPCPTCGFHVVTIERNFINIDEDDCF